MKRWPVVLLGALIFHDTSAGRSLDARRVELRALFCATSSGWHVMANAACATRAVATKQSAAGAVGRDSIWSVVRSGAVVMQLSARPTTGARAGQATANQATLSPFTYRITSPAELIPLVPDNDGGFERWTGPVVYRPIAVVTRDSVRDPEGWRATSLTTQELAEFARAFRRRVSLPTCEVVPPNAPASARRTFTTRELQVRGAHRASSGALLVGLVIDAALHPCDDVRDPARTTHWFVREARGVAGADGTPPRYVGNEMQLVDIADFDGDGTSEWLFSVARYNDDGYLLCTEHCRRSLRTNWHYQ